MVSHECALNRVQSATSEQVPTTRDHQGVQMSARQLNGRTSFALRVKDRGRGPHPLAPDGAGWPRPHGAQWEPLQQDQFKIISSGAFQGEVLCMIIEHW